MPWAKGFFSGVVIVAVTVWTGAFLNWGPRLESAWFPPLKREITDASKTVNSLTFYFEGTKLRDCELRGISAAWVFPGPIVMPATIMRADGSSLGTVLPSTIQAGDSFRAGPYVARISPTVAAEPNVILRVVNVYDCHILWETVAVTALPLADVPMEGP